jgi:hypothetical protein
LRLSRQEPANFGQDVIRVRQERHMSAALDDPEPRARQTGGELIKSINEAMEAGHRINIEWQAAGAL